MEKLLDIRNIDGYPTDITGNTHWYMTNNKYIWGGGNI